MEKSQARKVTLWPRGKRVVRNKNLKNVILLYIKQKVVGDKFWGKVDLVLKWL